MNSLQNNPVLRCAVFSNGTLSRNVIRKAKDTLLLVIPIFLLLGHHSIAQAQVFSFRQVSSFGNFGIQTSSDRFFEAGRAGFEQEIQRLQERPVSSEELLNVSRTEQIRQDLLRLETPQIPTEETPSNQKREDSETALPHQKQSSN